MSLALCLMPRGDKGTHWSQAHGGLWILQGWLVWGDPEWWAGSPGQGTWLRAFAPPPQQMQKTRLLGVVVPWLLVWIKEQHGLGGVTLFEERGQAHRPGMSLLS